MQDLKTQGPRNTSLEPLVTVSQRSQYPALGLNAKTDAYRIVIGLRFIILILLVIVIAILVAVSLNNI